MALLPTGSARAVTLLANDDVASVKHDRVLTVGSPGVLGNDLDVLGGTVLLVDDSDHGLLDLRADGGYTYTPDAGYVGVDSFRYNVRSLLLLTSNAATVTIHVVNGAPKANPDAYVVSGAALSVPAPGVLGNDTDPDGDALIVEMDGGGVSGSLDLEPDGSFTFSPGGGFSSGDSFKYRVWDGVAWSAATTVTLNRPASSPVPTPTPPPSTPAPTDEPTPESTPDPTPIPTRRPRASSGPNPAPPPGPAAPDASHPPVPVGELPPTPEPTPTPEAERSIEATPSPTPIGTPRETPAPNETGPTVPVPGAEPPAAGTGSGSRSVVDGLFAEPPPPDGEAAPAPVPLSLGALSLLGSVDTWIVPGMLLGVPGVLVIVFVLLQGAGAVAWIPAIRRLGRGEERPATA